MPDWYKQIPTEVRIITAIVAIFLAGVAAAPHLSIPDRVDELESSAELFRDLTDQRLATLETRFESLIERLDRYFCVELAEEAGASASDCVRPFLSTPNSLEPSRDP